MVDALRKLSTSYAGSILHELFEKLPLAVGKNPINSLPTASRLFSNL